MNIKYKRLLYRAAFLILFCFGPIATRGRTAEPVLTRFTFAEPHMGTRFQFILYAPDEAAARRTASAAFDRIAALDAIMSDYRPTSELMRLCEKAGREPVPVSEDLFTVLARAQEFSRLTAGAFDVTVGPVVRLWRETRKTRQLPDPKTLAEARALVGYNQVQLDEKIRTVRLLKPGMLLDLGGIAKGYAADAALAVLKKHGIDHALVAAGGDIAVSGPPPGSGGWTVGIASLERPNGKPRRSLLLKGSAVSTSGDAEQFVEIGGVRYSHIVDPRTGMALTGKNSVTVIAHDATTTDALATAVCILGSEKGLALVEKMEGVAAYFMRGTAKGEESFSSRRFADFHPEP
jgi:thiamine biosynthesis lipoprotein